MKINGQVLRAQPWERAALCVPISGCQCHPGSSPSLSCPGENPWLGVKRPGSRHDNCSHRTSSMPRTSHVMSEHQHLLQKELYPKRICYKPKHNKGDQRVRAA